MQKKAVSTKKLEPGQCAEFMVEAEASHQPASQLLSEAREYDEFLLCKIETARSSMHVGLGRSNDEVEAEFAARRAGVASSLRCLFR